MNKLTPDQINADTLIEDLITSYPELADYLIREYGFHCVNCFLAGFETLEEGARVHGLIDEEFEELLSSIRSLIST